MSDLTARFKALREAHAMACDQTAGDGDHDRATYDCVAALPALLDVAEAAAATIKFCECPVQEPGQHRSTCERLRAAMERLAGEKP